MLPLLTAVTVIIVAIVVIERNPFGGGSSDTFSGDPIIIDAPEGQSGDGVEVALEVDSKPKSGFPTAPEVEEINAWINSQPLMISDLRGKVVLVDFWTYTCVNCIRTFPYLKVWHSKYADDGLVILGVHTPEFKFEEKLENVHNAVKKYAITWPIAVDNNWATWRAYENRYWPAKYLIDKDGLTRYTHFGEGAYVETERKIRELLKETGADLSELNPDLPDFQPYDPSFLENPTLGITQELYAGWLRGNAIRGGYVNNGQEGYKAHDKVFDYMDPGKHEKHLMYLQGPWHKGQESLKHGRETSNFEDYISLIYAAKSANAVIKLDGEDTEPFKVLVTLDGKNLDESNKGDDVVIDKDGKSFLHVDQARLYSIVNTPNYGVYELKLSSNSEDFVLFAFTFGVYESGV